MSTIYTVRADRFKPSARSILEDVKMSSLYNHVKNRIPKKTRTIIKSSLNKMANKSNSAMVELGEASSPYVSRQMWYLQTVKHKLSNEKFKKTFGFLSPFSFDYGTKMTHNWLRFLNL